MGAPYQATAEKEKNVDVMGRPRVVTGNHPRVVAGNHPRVVTGNHPRVVTGNHPRVVTGKSVVVTGKPILGSENIVFYGTKFSGHRFGHHFGHHFGHRFGHHFGHHAFRARQLFGHTFG